MPTPFVTTAGAAEILGVTTYMVRYLMYKQQLVPRKTVQRIHFFDRAEVEALAAKRTQQPRRGGPGRPSREFLLAEGALP